MKWMIGFLIVFWGIDWILYNFSDGDDFLREEVKTNEGSSNYGK